MPKDNENLLEQYRREMTEVIPGVFVNAGDSVHIVDDQGEVCMWNADEWTEDPEAVTATVNAVIVAAVRGTKAVRENIAEQGTLLEGLIRQTRRKAELARQEPPDPETLGCLFVDDGVNGHVTIDGRKSVPYHLERHYEDGRAIEVYFQRAPRMWHALLDRVRRALAHRFNVRAEQIYSVTSATWKSDWKMEVKLD